MATDPEQEALNLVLERHRSNASENDVRTAFQRFMEIAGVAATRLSTAPTKRYNTENHTRGNPPCSQYRTTRT